MVSNHPGKGSDMRTGFVLLLALLLAGHPSLLSVAQAQTTQAVSSVRSPAEFAVQPVTMTQPPRADDINSEISLNRIIFDAPVWTLFSFVLMLTSLLPFSFFALDAETYLQIQPAHQVITFFAVGSYILYSLIAFLKAFTLNQERIPEGFVYGQALFSLNLFLNIFAILVLNHEKKAEIKNTRDLLSLGQFQLADGNSAIGIYGSFPF